MRHITSSILLFYLATLLAPAVIMLDFLIEQDRIAHELCVQRDVPESRRTCHGQCHLMKQLKQAQDPGPRHQSQLPTFRYGTQFCESTIVVSLADQRRALAFTGPREKSRLLPGFAACPEAVPWA